MVCPYFQRPVGGGGAISMSGAMDGRPLLKLKKDFSLISNRAASGKRRGKNVLIRNVIDNTRR